MDTRLEQIRLDFPILSEKVHGKNLVYLDNAATTQKPNVVIDALSSFYRHDNSNVHRGVHTLSHRATEYYELSRKIVSQFIHAASADEIIFTRGTTESLNLAANSLETMLNEGDEILCTEMEHHSNFVPWQVMAKRRRAIFKVARISEKGELSLKEINDLITDRTKIVAITHASNTLGTINDIKTICRMAHEKKAIVVVDGAQFIAHGEVNVSELGCDFYAFSGHKLFGPTGIGVLYGKKEILEKMPPYQYGGGMISEVNLESSTFTSVPQVFEAGTPNISGAYGLSKAIEYVEKTGYDFIQKHEKNLLDYATENLMAVPGIKIYGTSEHKVSLLSFNISGIHPLDLGTVLDQMGVAIRTGHHCTQPIMKYYGIQGAARLSFAFYNTKAEIDAFIDAVYKAIKLLTT